MSAPLTTATQVNQAQASVLTQTTLDATMKRPSPATLVNTKKRKLTLADGSELDLNGSLPITADIMLAMRARIFELEDQLAAQQVKEQSSERPAKRARVSSGAENAAADAGAEAGPSSAPSKEDEKKRKMQVKKILDRLKKDCKAADVKFQGSPKTIKFDEILEFAEFQALFGSKGTLIQPTPQNKPTSTVTIIHFNSAQLVDFFGADITKLKGNAWTRGGGPRFAKSVKLGQCDLRVDSLDINYSKNGMKCTLKFEVDDASGMSGCYGPSARRSMGFWF